MKMEQYRALINDLGQMAGDPVRPVVPFYALALVAGGFLVVAFGLVLLGMTENAIRPDYAASMKQSLVVAKQIIPLLIMAACLPVLLTLTRPEAKPGYALWFPVAILMLMPVMLAVTLASARLADWPELITGPSSAQCLIAIPLLSVMLTLAQMVALRRGATTRPLLAGWLAGLAAGALAAVVYALVCTEDTPAFYGLWYSLGIACSGGLGVIAGRYLLRW